jgi:hypothetical protein
LSHSANPATINFRIVSSPQRKPYAHQPMFSISLSPAPVAPDLLSVSVDLPVLHFSHKWSHTTCGLCAWFSPSIRAVACVRT